jgi:hypothetical protein
MTTDFNKLDTTVQRVLLDIAAEYERAKKKHPRWPWNDYIHAAAIVAEESGELIRAAIQYNYENGNAVDMEKEAIQTGAMIVRFLIAK